MSFFQISNINMLREKDMASEIAIKSAKATENIILAQLNDFISRGLIEIEVTQPVFVRAMDSDVIEMKQAVNLVLKDKQYIETLEAKVKKYEKIFEALKEGN